MTESELARELGAAVLALTDAQHEELVQAGVDRLDIALLIGAAYGHVVGDRFEPHPDGGEPPPPGSVAFCTPIRADPFRPLSIETPVAASALRVGEIIDLVFWHPAAPERWALRTGAAECLGLIEPQCCDPEPVRIHRGIISWFRHRCDGLVILTRDPWRVHCLLSQCRGGLVAEDQRHAADLHQMLDHPWPKPEITVMKGETQYAERARL